MCVCVYVCVFVCLFVRLGLCLFVHGVVCCRLCIWFEVCCSWFVLVVWSWCLRFMICGLPRVFGHILSWIGLLSVVTRFNVPFFSCHFFSWLAPNFCLWLFLFLSYVSLSWFLASLFSWLIVLLSLWLAFIDFQLIVSNVYFMLLTCLVLVTCFHLLVLSCTFIVAELEWKP